MEKETLKKPYLVAVILQALLCLAGLTLTIIDTAMNPLSFFANTVSIVMYVIIIFYALIGYKIPHDNLFRYALLFYSVLYGAIYLLSTELSTPMALKVGNLLCVVMIAFMSGRLQKIKDCTIIAVLVETLFLLSSALGFALEYASSSSVSVLSKIALFNQPVLWACFATAYLIRYQRHKDAGTQE